MKNTKKTLLIATDILGISAAFLTLLKDVDCADQAVVVSPYQQPKGDFKTEQQAYQCFQAHGGINAYIVSLMDLGFN